MDRKRIYRSPWLWVAAVVVVLFLLPNLLSGNSSYHAAVEAGLSH